MAVGVARRDAIFTSAATGIGNPIVYLGSKTGRDGIHGASMASAAFEADAEEKRPTVQVGDPFAEKLLLEACLELMALGRGDRHSGHGRGGARPPRRPRWGPRAISASTSTSTTCRAVRPA